MPTRASQAIQLLRNAEQELRALIAQAAGEGDYESLDQLTTLAKKVRELSGGAELVTAQEANYPGSTPRLRAGIDVQSLDLLQATKRSNGRVRRAKKYPKFRRRGGRLVKIGWSKSKKATYEHKADRKVVEAVVDRILEIGANRKTFEVEQVANSERDGDGPIPAYQIYLCIGWFLHIGVLEQHGRKGYSVAAERDLAKQVGGAWSRLTAR